MRYPDSGGLSPRARAECEALQLKTAQMRATGMDADDRVGAGDPRVGERVEAGPRRRGADPVASKRPGGTRSGTAIPAARAPPSTNLSPPPPPRCAANGS